MIMPMIACVTSCANDIERRGAARSGFLASMFTRNWECCAFVAGAISTAYACGWSLATTLMTCVVVFRAGDDDFGVMTSAEYDGDPEIVELCGNVGDDGVRKAA